MCWRGYRLPWASACRKHKDLPLAVQYEKNLPGSLEDDITDFSPRILSSWPPLSLRPAASFLWDPRVHTPEVAADFCFPLHIVWTVGETRVWKEGVRGKIGLHSIGGEDSSDSMAKDAGDLPFHRIECDKLLFNKKNWSGRTWRGGQGWSVDLSVCIYGALRSREQQWPQVRFCCPQTDGQTEFIKGWTDRTDRTTGLLGSAENLAPKSAGRHVGLFPSLCYKTRGVRL